MNCLYWERLYFAYCIGLGRSDKEFFVSSTAKIIRILEMYMGKNLKNVGVETVNSMRDFLK